MDSDFDNIPTGVGHNPNEEGVTDQLNEAGEDREAGRSDRHKRTHHSNGTEAGGHSRGEFDGIVEQTGPTQEQQDKKLADHPTDSHPTLMPLNSGSKPRFNADASGANLQVKTPTNDQKTASLVYNPFKHGSHTVLNGLGNQKPSASNMALSFGVDKLTPTLNSPVQRSSDKLPEAKALLVPVPPYQDVEDGAHPTGARASSALKKKVPTLSESRFKKKSHLKMMAEVVEFAAMAPEGGGKAVPSDPNQYRSKKYANTHGNNTRSRESSAQLGGAGRPELFLRRPRAEEPLIKKIDHEAIRNHANSFMVHQIESDIARENRRKQFLEEWRKNELHANRTRSQEIASSYRRLYREHLEKSLEYKANATIGKSMSPDAVRERLANRNKYAEMVRQITKSSPKHTMTDNSNTSLVKNEKSGPPRTIFEAIEKQRKRSQDTNKHRHLLGNEYMKFAITKAKEEGSLNRSHNDKPKAENLQEYAPVREASARRPKVTYNIHEIFQSKEPLGLESTHYARLENIRKTDNFKSAHSRAIAVGAIKSIDQELAKKEKTGQNPDQLDRDYLRSIHTKLEVLGLENGTIPKKYAPLGFKPATQRLQSALVPRVQSSVAARLSQSPRLQKDTPMDNARIKSAASLDKRPAASPAAVAKNTSPTPNKGVESTNALLQPNNTRKDLKGSPSKEKEVQGPAASKPNLITSKKDLQPSPAALKQKP